MTTAADHDTIRAGIPAASRGALSAEELQRLEAHVEECSECAGVLALARELATLESHPPISEIRAFALATGDSRQPAIAAHVQRCASCALASRCG